MRVAFFLQYADMGSSSKYRVLIYKNEFDKKYDTKYFHFWSNRYVQKYLQNKKKYVLPIAASYIKNMIKRIIQILFIVPRYDVIVIQRCLLPFASVKFWLKYLNKKNVRVIYDIDDALHIYPKYHCSDIAQFSECVMAGSKNLIEYYENYGKKIVYIPTVDDDRKYSKYKKNTFSNKCIGWIGSVSTVPNLEVVADAINKLCEENPEVYLKVIADTPGGFENKIKRFKFVKWNKDTYIDEMSEFTIGIMPLTNNEFNKGKCGFKLIQYMDLEKPVVATDCGENVNIVQNFGEICFDEAQWYDKISKLLFDEDRYKVCVDNIRNYFLQQYSFENTLMKIETVIEGKG